MPPTNPEIRVHNGDQVLLNARVIVERGNKRLKEWKKLADLRLHTQLQTVDDENLAVHYLSNFKLLAD